MVDVGGLEGEGGRGVEGVLLVLERRVGGVLVDGGVVCKRKSRSAQLGAETAKRLTERSSLALVHVELVALAGDDNVPRVDGTGGAHEHGEDGVGSEDLSLVLGGELLEMSRNCQLGEVGDETTRSD